MNELIEPWLEEWQVRKVMTELLFEEGNRFKGCPPICLAENLPAFDSEEHAVKWRDRPKEGNPLYEPNPINKLWKCISCGRWRFLTKHRPPSGSTSGSSRTR